MDPTYRRSGRRRRTVVATVAAAALLAGTAAILDAAPARASQGCTVDYSVNDWGSGFTANITITNGSAADNGWSLGFSFPGNQQITQGWSAQWSQSGSQVTANNETWNANLGAGQSITMGFNASYSGSNPAPTAFSLNGIPCNGDQPPTCEDDPTLPGCQEPPSGELPDSFSWESSDVLISPRPDAGHPFDGIKDPTVVYADGAWHVFASEAGSEGYNLLYLTFTDWSQAGSATQHFLDQSPIGSGYRAAPEVFYFEPHGLWYLVYQDGNAAYSTNPDISNPNGWTAPRHFYSSMPDIIEQNIGDGYWVDMWVICDAANCHLFSSDDNGHLYRSQTPVGDFPNGFDSNTVIALQDPDRYNLFEAANVYKVDGSDEYLLLVEAIGSEGRRWFRSWTATDIAGPWTPLADTEGNPFAHRDNVTFNGTPWTADISHGEMIRSGVDQRLTISACDMRYVYQGKDPDAGGDYNSLPWRLALLEQTNSTC